MDRVLVIAGGPTANLGLFRGLEHHPDQVWGCNRALRLYDRLDHYVATDPRNQAKYEADMAKAVERGTQLWLPPWYKGTLKHTEFTYEREDPLTYARDRIAHGRAVGLVTLQLALRQNPAEVILVGFDGYASDALTKWERAGRFRHPEMENYPDGRTGWWRDMNGAMQHVINLIAADRTDVKFTWVMPQILEVPKGWRTV